MTSTLVWFRQDLRIADNPALAHAAARGRIVPLYILDDVTAPARWRMGSASRWWLHHSLTALRDSLGGLIVLRGDPRALIADAVKASGASSVVWNRCYEPWAIARDGAIKAQLAELGVDAASFNGSLLNEPIEIATRDGKPFKVFTPFWRACRARAAAAPQLAARFETSFPPGFGVSIDALDLTPKKPNWAARWRDIWTPGEAGANLHLNAFVDAGLSGYSDGRDRPDLPKTSRLSPHLHFGEISPRQIWRCIEMAVGDGRATHRDAEKFQSEIGWREFAYHLLYHFPSLPDANWREAFDAFAWRNDAVELRAWQRGLTGYPFVDAGMRELWQTGVMHNRVRMIAASFLVKHLRTDWRTGEDWFWDTLVDADLANNAAGWQWVAGSGADAAPYFRIFNPVTQGRKFDPQGSYVRRWCPELANLPDEFIHAPFEAPADVLARSGVRLGTNYPAPIVGHAKARAAALEGYAATNKHRHPPRNPVAST